MPDPALLQVLVDQGIAAREFNELMRESMETYERDNLAMRTTLENQQTLLETQQAAIAATQATTLKTAKLLRKNLNSDSDISDDKLNFSKPGRLKAKKIKAMEAQRNDPGFGAYPIELKSKN